MQDPASGGAIVAGYGGVLGQNYGAALAAGAPASALGLSADALTAFNTVAATGDITGAVAAAAGTMALEAANAYVALANMSAPSSFSNQLWDLT